MEFQTLVYRNPHGGIIKKVTLFFSCWVVSKSFATLWTVVRQAPLPARLLCPWHFPGKNTGVGCHCLLQEIFWTQRSNTFPALVGRFVTTWAIKEALYIYIIYIVYSMYIYIDRYSQFLYPRGFPGGASGKEPTCQCRRPKRCGFNPCIMKIPWSRAWQLIPVFLPREAYGQRSLVGYSL